MYLVDTSVWVDYLAGRNQRHVMFLDGLLSNPVAVGICDVISMELLQGARDTRGFTRLQGYLESQRFYRFADSTRSHADAARIYFECRRKGVSVRSSTDCLIAQCAIENEAVLLHNDRGFSNMATIVKSLREKAFLQPSN